MNTQRLIAGITSFALVGGAVLAGPMAAFAQNRQKDKNNMRNLGVVLGAAAAHQAVKGKGTNALILGAGAAYSGKKYEDARKAQAKDSRHERVGREYRYRNGKRVGYYRLVNGKRAGYVSL